jgi:4'-phosphopantetheinyl transferase
MSSVATNAECGDLVPEDRSIGSVEVALFDLNVSREALSAYESVLDTQERRRAAQFHHNRDRDRFIARHGQLRARLGQELGEAPDTICICADAHGKPFLPDHPELRFNLSSSKALALCVIGRGVEIGCDIEWRAPELACRGVADRLFAPAERAALAVLPEALWVEGFFNCWTRKEAYVKALGLGLSYPLDAFRVSVAPGDPARLFDCDPGWSLTSFEPAPGYQAALATGPYRCLRALA